MTIWRKKVLHTQTNFFFRGVQLWQLFFIVDEKRVDPNTIKRGSSLARQRNAIWWPNINNAGLEVLWYPGVTSIAKEPYNCLIFQRVQTPVPYLIYPLWIRACLELPRIDLLLEPNEPAHEIFGGSQSGTSKIANQ